MFKISYMKKKERERERVIESRNSFGFYHRVDLGHEFRINWIAPRSPLLIFFSLSFTNSLSASVCVSPSRFLNRVQHSTFINMVRNINMSFYFFALLSFSKAVGWSLILARSSVITIINTSGKEYESVCTLNFLQWSPPSCVITFHKTFIGFKLGINIIKYLMHNSLASPVIWTYWGHTTRRQDLKQTF